MSFAGLGRYNFEMREQIEESYYDITGAKPNVETIIEIAKNLPKDIHALAKKWDWNDTEVRDKVFRYIKENFSS